jgi:nitrite reductase/ring-hydroxylating ferredoxin subunit
MTTRTEKYLRAISLEELKSEGRKVVNLNGQTLLLVWVDDEVFAVDNRCPHMGFPLHRGTVEDGILTCHWHHARFDLRSGGTFDRFADDVRSYPVEVREGDVWVDPTPLRDEREHQERRMREGLEDNIPLVIAKSSISLLDQGVEVAEPFRIGIEFGTRYRSAGWGQGLTMHTCMINLLPHLLPENRPRALYHGLSAVAADSSGMAARFVLRGLPDTTADLPTLKRWFRRFVEVRDQEGAERCIVSALDAGAGPNEMADLLYSSATDHRYLTVGHVADFTNKALEALDVIGWDQAPLVLTSLARAYASASRMEESNSWRHPVDLVTLLEGAFDRLDEVQPVEDRTWDDGIRAELVEVLLGDDPEHTVESLLAALKKGASLVEVAQVVAHAAARRIAHFHVRNEFSDWDTALHTFTFANAMHQGIRRSPSRAAFRGVLDAAMSIYLDRFLNVPPTPIPQSAEVDPEEVLNALPSIFDQKGQVNEAGKAVSSYLGSGGDPLRLIAVFGGLLLHEDRDFHTIQTVEAAVRQFYESEGSGARSHLLVAAARYLAAHSPTVRAQGQTFEIAHRLHRGERLYEDLE